MPFILFAIYFEKYTKKLSKFNFSWFYMCEVLPQETVWRSAFFVNSALKLHYHIVKNTLLYTPTDYFFGDFAHWVQPLQASKQARCSNVLKRLKKFTIRWNHRLRYARKIDCWSGVSHLLSAPSDLTQRSEYPSWRWPGSKPRTFR